ncbi:MAG: helix-turn-helix transcriptional regulator [Proteobacteria bacterium]|nr:helix-turn-helix transcriptional regulator [Pseudomonadota bacterium]
MKYNTSVVCLRKLWLFLLVVFTAGCQKPTVETGGQVSELTEATVHEFLSRFERFIENGEEENLPFFVSEEVVFNYSFDEYNIHIRHGGFKRLKTQLFFESVVSVGTRLERTAMAIDIVNQGQTAMVEQDVQMTYAVLNHRITIERNESITVRLQNGYPLITSWTVASSLGRSHFMDDLELILIIVIIILLENLIFVLFLNNRHQAGGKLLIVLFLMMIAGSINHIVAFYWAGFGMATSLSMFVYMGYPYVLYLFTKISFQDTFELKKRHPVLTVFFMLFCAGLASVKFFMYYYAETSEIVYWISNGSFFGISIPICLYCFYLTIRDSKSDLVEARRRFRLIAILLILLNLTLLSISNVLFLFYHIPHLVVVEKVTAILFILFLTSRLAKRDAAFFEIHPLGHNRITEEKKMDSEEDTRYLKDLNAQMSGKNIFCEEGLTIGRLADHMQVQEYKLRRLINRKLGFRNFNEYINQFRMDEAAFQLTDPTTLDKPILNIALDIGYKSMTNFNKHFKEKFGTTPSEYRKRRGKA